MKSLISAIPNIPVNLHSRLEIVDGHYLYENLYYKNPNGPINIDDAMYSKKSEHYIVNPNWAEEKLIHEMSYAWVNKRLFIRKPAMNQSLLGTQYPVVEEKFVSNFSKGTKIEFTVRSHQVDPVTNTLKYNHLGLMAIMK